MYGTSKPGMSRRAVLGAGAAAAGLLAMPTVMRAQDRSLKVGVYGGYFKDSFDKNIFPDFTKASGIAVESIAEPTGEAWLVQLEQAAKAGQAPADLSMMSQVSTLKGEQTELWTPLDPSKIKNYDNLLERFVAKYPDGRVAGIGAVAALNDFAWVTAVDATGKTIDGSQSASGGKLEYGAESTEDIEWGFRPVLGASVEITVCSLD